MSLTATAQTTIFDFEGAAPTLGDFNGSVSTVIDNPDAMEPNTSAKVIENVVPAGAAFAGVNIPQAINLADGKFFTLQVWSPVANAPMLLKFEGGADPATIERAVNATGAANAWQEITFSFENEADLTFTSVSVFMNFNVVGTEELTFYWDNLAQDVTGSVVFAGPDTAAPTPTRDAADVISLFSDAYTNVAVDTFRADFGDAIQSDTLIDGNSTLLYLGLSFTGIETLGDNAIDLVAAGMTHLHVDFWSANSTTFGMKLVDFGGDGFGNDNDTEFEIQRNLPQFQWVSVDYPLPAFEGMNQDDISQLIISSAPGGLSNVFLDNIYFYAGEPLGTQMNLPVTFDEEDVDYGVLDFEGAVSAIVADPEDATNTVVETTKLAGAATFAGTTLTSTTGGPVGFSSAIPLAAGASTMSMRVWSPTAGTPVMIKVENKNDPTVSVETLTNTTVAGAWDTLTFDFSMERTGTAAVNYASVYDKASIFFDFDTSPAADATYYWDDVVFGGEGSTGGGGDDEPMIAAPTPTRDAADVISMYSDAYTDVPVDTWRTDWSMATLEDIMIAGNPTKKYTSLEFVGVETVNGNEIDLTTAGMTHLHFDYWTPNMDTLQIKLVDFGMDGFDNGTDTEFEIPFRTTKNEWVGLDIPLTDFAGMNQTDIAQFILSSRPAGTGTLFIDNVYYYNDLTGTNTPVLGLLEVFPNPVIERVMISAPARITDLILYDVNGRVVSRHQPEALSFDLDMSDLKPGFYVALANTVDGAMTVKLLKE